MPKANAADTRRTFLDGAMPDIEAQFRALVQSPLRAGLLRHLHAHPDQAHAWPGDLAELEQTVAHAASVSHSVIDEEALGLSPAPPPRDQPARLATLRDAERAHVARVLDAVGWNKKEAARVLDISRGTLYRKIGDYGLAPRGAAGSPVRPALPPEARRGRTGIGSAG